MREWMRKRLFEEIMAQDSPNLVKDINFLVQEVQTAPSKICKL